MLRVSDLRCGYADKTVLADVSFEINPGEVVALLGLNGSGKSTLLKTLSGLVKPLAGEVEVGRVALATMDAKGIARQIATVPQDEMPAFAFTALQVVTMGRLAKSQSLFDGDEDLKVANDALAKTDCLEFADRPFAELSGGERQRVLIARALAQDTPIVFLDEPSSHLDPPHQLWLAQLLRELRSENKAVLFAIHDINLAGAMAERALLLNEGRLAHDLPIEDLFKSKELDTVYGVEFERLITPSGRVILQPSFP